MLKYRWLYIPTGETGEREISPTQAVTTSGVKFVLNRRDLMEAVNTWNRQGGKLWKYWVD